MKNMIENIAIYYPDNPAHMSPKAKDTLKKLEHLIKTNDLMADDSTTPDLVIALGGDGTFLRSCHKYNFDKNYAFAGVNTGTLGFLQDIAPEEIYTLIEYLKHNNTLDIQKVYLGNASIHYKNGKTNNLCFLNEFLLGGVNYSRIDFNEFLSNEFLQSVSATAIVFCTPTGQTAFSMSCGGPINFSNTPLITSMLFAPISNTSKPRFISNSLENNEFTIRFKEARNDVCIKCDGEHIGDESPSKIEEIKIWIDEDTFINKIIISDTSKIHRLWEKFINTPK